MSAILWRLLDFHAAVADPNDAKEYSKEVRLSELLTHADLSNKLGDMTERELLKYALNTVHEQSVVVYLTHHYCHEVVTTLTGDSLFSRGPIDPHTGEDRRGGEEGPENDLLSQGCDSPTKRKGKGRGCRWRRRRQEEEVDQKATATTTTIAA
jgi:hypothetical protein